MKIREIDILGTKISVLNFNDLIELIDSKIKHESNFICVAAVHPLMESLASKKLQKGMNDSLVTTADGMPLVWIAQYLLKRKVTRMYGPDIMLKMCLRAEKKGYKVFLLGGFNGVTEILKLNLIKKFPKLKIVGVEETPVRPIPKLQNKTIIKKIRASKADIVFVGMGCPMQEKWMIENYKKFKSGVFIGVGAAFDFFSGRVKQAPRWMRKYGLEWLFRLLQEPRRLWRRYIIINSRFVFKVLPRYKEFNEKEVTIS